MLFLLSEIQHAEYTAAVEASAFFSASRPRLETCSFMLGKRKAEAPSGVPSVAKQRFTVLSRDGCVSGHRLSDGRRSAEWGSDTLCSLVIGSCRMQDIFPLDEEARDVLEMVTADYLDPFIDGDVPAADYDNCSAGSFLHHLRKAWHLRHWHAVAVPDMPVPAVALAQYIVHAIRKMNAQCGFTYVNCDEDGMCYRLPIPKAAATAHCQRLGNALAEAIARDFTEADRCFGPDASCLTAKKLTEAATVHLDQIVLDCFAQEDHLQLLATRADIARDRSRERLRKLHKRASELSGKTILAIGACALGALGIVAASGTGML